MLTNRGAPSHPRSRNSLRHGPATYLSSITSTLSIDPSEHVPFSLCLLPSATRRGAALACLTTGVLHAKPPLLLPAHTSTDGRAGGRHGRQASIAGQDSISLLPLSSDPGFPRPEKKKISSTRTSSGPRPAAGRTEQTPYVSRSAHRPAPRGRKGNSRAIGNGCDNTPSCCLPTCLALLL